MKKKIEKLCFAGLKVNKKGKNIKFIQPDNSYFCFDLEKIKIKTWENSGKRGAKISNGCQVLDGWLLFPPAPVGKSNDIPEGMPKLVSLRDLSLLNRNFEKELLTEPKNQSLINAIYFTSKSILDGAKSFDIKFMKRSEEIINFMKMYTTKVI